MPALRAAPSVFVDPARDEAARVNRVVADGADPGPLAGVPFAVKNLFDVAGVVTVAGSRIHAERPPAVRDAAAVASLRRAGAVLVGALNMDEYACGFTTENSHAGPTRNPHDRARIAGGSSGGSGAAVAAGLVPLALGTDTNGSIRDPAPLIGAPRTTTVEATRAARGRGRGLRARRALTVELNRPEVVAEVTAAFQRYEAALNATMTPRRPARSRRTCCANRDGSRSRRPRLIGAGAGARPGPT